MCKNCAGIYLDKIIYVGLDGRCPECSAVYFTIPEDDPEVIYLEQRLKAGL